MTFRASSSAALPSPASGLPSPVSNRGRGPAPSNRRASKGFTLVELLIGATLSAAVLAAVLSSYLYLSRQLARLAHQQTLETQARNTLGTFTQDAQRATGVVTISTSPTSPAANRLDVTVPATGTSGTNTITYYYNSGTSATNVTVNGTSVSMPATALTRCVYNGSTVTSQTLLRYITSLTLSYYDSSGNIYTSYTDYLPGIKQLSLEFATQTGVAASGTQTPVHRGNTGRLALRNRGFLQ